MSGGETFGGGRVGFAAGGFVAVGEGAGTSMFILGGDGFGTGAVRVFEF